LGPIPLPPPGMVVHGGPPAQMGGPFSPVGGIEGANGTVLPSGPMDNWVHPSGPGQHGLRASPPQGHPGAPHQVEPTWGGRGPPSGEPHSPGGGQRRFMGAMAELRPGPSEEQRRIKEAQRLQLQLDLQEQVSLDLSWC
jgi:hypothetical protein